MLIVKGSLTQDFHKSVSPWPLSISLGPFSFFFKFADIFANKCLSAVSTTTAKEEKNIESLVSTLYI